MPTELWTDEFLDRALNEGDARADAAVAAIFKDGTLTAVNDAFNLLLKSDRLDRAALPVELRDFLDETGRLPEWADPKLIDRAERFFLSWGPLSLASLASAALPECYTLWQEAHVLGITRRLTEKAQRRILETAQYTVRVMQEDGLTAGGPGVRATQMVRLLHATMRRFIAEPPPEAAATRGPENHLEAMQFIDWPKTNGTPISQEHLAYTLLTFAYVLPRSLGVFGARVSDEDWRAHLHCWNVAGHVLGVRRDLMAETKEEAEWLLAKIKLRHQRDTAEGRALTASVLGWLQAMIPRHWRGWLDWLPPLVTWMLLDPATAAKLGVPTPGWFKRAGVAIYRTLPSLLKPNLVFGRWFVAHMTTLPRHWERQLFDLPASLQEVWGVKPPPPAAPVAPAAGPR